MLGRTVRSLKLKMIAMLLAVLDVDDSEILILAKIQFVVLP